MKAARAEPMMLAEVLRGLELVERDRPVAILVEALERFGRERVLHHHALAVVELAVAVGVEPREHLLLHLFALRLHFGVVLGLLLRVHRAVPVAIPARCSSRNTTEQAASEHER